ncbi:exosome complex exonuclease RRP46 homolog [Selaginella moellendorffii]|uniref:exosome complex exonuclease RRP46 homolog n=1 Tax=Selaginella moellendorffii TaxID=88036 RepID=UPI000D1CD190|nr:exosome complex exonuclease RRP46 homolog [Selaginella moellendorffii]XP_024521340.1 exosome complex exonuclease RRP46 homolog [Selaginella moellendorffii]XP_024521341.1 exosome complex exonuclease RRP46 homolog [Selaginella moellendorffii]|eukprot:XP_002993020.2 exosome complex exonuclease RRP46 homolog [Selaginella moellendorffii]
MATMARGDGRSADQIRPLACTTGLLHRAHGSARWSQEKSIVLAAVYGPKAVSGKQENAERATVEVIWKAKAGLSGSSEKEAEVILRRTIEYIIMAAQHPNTGISVIVQVVSDDGALLACAVNAACAALVDAGIPLNGLLAAVTCGVTSGGEILLDPTRMEEQRIQAHVCLVFKSPVASVVPGMSQHSGEDAIVTSITRGSMSVDSYLDCLARAKAACKMVSEFSRSSIEKKQIAMGINSKASDS